MKVTQIINHLHWPLALFTMLVFFALIKLGVWQSERATEKQQRLAKIEKIAGEQVIPLAQAFEQQSSMDINDLKVQVTGAFDPERVMLLDNQVHQGKVGYRVLQVVNHQLGSSLVNLGWIAGTRDRAQLPQVEPLTGKHNFNGNLRQIEVGVMLQSQQFENISWPLVIQQIELDKLSELLGLSLGDYVIYLDKQEPIGFVKNWQPIVMPPEKHQAYAFQWFSLATAWILLMGWAFFKSYNNKKLKAL